MAYKMVAERDGSIVKVERESSLVIVAKARIWISEGWKVEITDSEGKPFAADQLENVEIAA